MGKKAPDPTPPRETAAAQTGTNVSTAVANAYLGNITEHNPYGSTVVKRTGTEGVFDPYTKKYYKIPTFTRVTRLSDTQRKLKDLNDRTAISLGRTGLQQSERINKLLSSTLDTDGLPDAGNAGDIRRADLQRVGAGPRLATNIAGAGPVRRRLGSAGRVRGTYGTDFSDDRQRVEDALLARMAPQLEQDRDRLEARLASQGIRIGSEAYNAAIDDHSRRTTDARYGAILNAGQEQSRLSELEAARAAFENAAQAQRFDQVAQRGAFANAAQAQAFQQAGARAAFGNEARQNMYANQLQGAGFNNQAALQEANADLARFQAANTARDRAFQERVAVRNQPLNEVIGLLSGSQVQYPQFMGANMPTIPTTDVAGIIANYDRNRIQAANANNSFASGLLGDFLGFGSSLLTRSDRRSKTDIRRIGKTDDGQNIYRFRYRSGGPIQMGLMAQEVETRKPEAVTEVAGTKMVDYGKALKPARKRSRRKRRRRASA